jgi:hypothetical protein
MAWRELGEDRKVEVIVDPDFRGELITIAARHPIWIVETPANAPRIEASWLVGKDMDVCIINRYRTSDASDRKESLVAVLDNLDLHHGYTAGGSYNGIVVNGLHPNAILKEKLETLGFEIVETTADGFVALGTLSGAVGMKRFAEL